MWGMGVYVITTLRFLRHMGSVEWVTFQGPESHWRDGGGIEGEGEAVGSVDGARRVTMVAGWCWVRSGGRILSRVRLLVVVCCLLRRIMLTVGDRLCGYGG